MCLSRQNVKIGNIAIGSGQEETLVKIGNLGGGRKSFEFLVLSFELKMGVEG
jgi:hypothetical protein